MDGDLSVVYGSDESAGHGLRTGADQEGVEPQFKTDFSGSAPNAVHAAFVGEAEGTLRLETGSRLLLLIVNAAELVLAVGLIYILYLLRGVVRAALEGDPFSQENGIRLRRWAMRCSCSGWWLRRSTIW